MPSIWPTGRANDRVGGYGSSDPGYNADRSEPVGEDIVIFSVGLDAATANPTLLRYMANIGDDGSRANDPCVVSGIPSRQPSVAAIIIMRLLALIYPAFLRTSPGVSSPRSAGDGRT